MIDGVASRLTIRPFLPGITPSSSTTPKTIDSKLKPSNDEIRKRKNLLGTWLSPIPQPAIRSQPFTLAPTVDAVLRKYLGECALALEELVKESIVAFGVTPSESFAKTPLPAALQGKGTVTKAALSYSTSRCPLKAPWEILPETAVPSLQREKITQNPQAGSVKFGWIERGTLSLHDEVHSGIYSYQVRHHTKLEAFHDIDRPVFCINLKTECADLLDLRLISLLHTEFAFLTAAAKHFSTREDAWNGSPVIDKKGRVFVDERIVRRAGYHYTNYQRSLYDTVRQSPFAVNDSNLPLETRYAHFLIFRSHLPQLSTPLSLTKEVV